MSIIRPTFTGFIETTKDALLILEACLQGHLLHVPRPLSCEEAESVILNGSIFIYELGCSGVREWLDYRCWGQQVRLGDFHVSTEIISKYDPSAKPGGFLKQTISLYWNEIQHQVIAYRLLKDDYSLGITGSNASCLLCHIHLRSGLVEDQRHLRHGVDFVLGQGLSAEISRVACSWLLQTES